jgi:hypothetical protein
MLNNGSFGLNRTGHGGSARDSNYNFGRNYFTSFLKCDYVRLMSEDDDDDLEAWIQQNEGAEFAICDIEVIQQFASWLCNHASYGKCNDPLKLGSISDILSSVKSIFNKIFPNNKIFSGNTDVTRSDVVHQLEGKVKSRNNTTRYKTRHRIIQ